MAYAVNNPGGIDKVAPEPRPLLPKETSRQEFVDEMWWEQ